MGSGNRVWVTRPFVGSQRRVWLVAVLTLIGCGSPPGPEPTGQVRGALNVGDPVRTVMLPPEISCPDDLHPGGPHVAISVAAVPAPDVGVTGLGNKTLLATSCRDAAGSKIFFLDPGSADTTETTVTGTVVKELTVDLVPPNGWGALAFRGDVKPPDVLACDNPASDAHPHGIYSINLSTGHVTHLFDAAMPTPGRPFCDGLAWDTGNDTIYMSPDISNTVYHYSWDGFTATLVNTLPVTTACSTAVTDEGPAGNSGIVVVGPDLLLACDGLSTIFEISKTDGSVVRTFASGAERAEDMECDPSTFGPDVSVAWTKDAFKPQLLSFVVPPGTCGLCRSAQRPDLNNDLTPAQRQTLANLELEYLTREDNMTLQRGAIVAEHRDALNTWHSAPQFFPGHRGFIGEFEFWLANVKGHPEFVPLPKWHPANPVPPEFAGTDTAACTDSTQLPPATSPGACGGSPVTGSKPPLPAQFQWDFPGGPVCSAFADIAAVQSALEGPYHGSAVHCGVFTHSSTMCDVTVSPSSLIFLPWHAFVDDVAYNYECKCKGSCSVCTELFTPFMAGTARGPQPFAPNDKVKAPPRPNLGFWWWFEDQVVPPDVTPRFVTDHSGLFLRGEVRSRPALVPGIVGQAIDLDGKDDFVVAVDRATGEVGMSDFTLDGWVKTSASGLQPIVSKLADDGDDDDHDGHDGDHDGDDHDGDHDRKHRGGFGHRSEQDTGYALFLKDGQLGLFLGTTRRQGTFITARPGSIADGAWHHVAAVVDREYPTRSKLFVDGVVALDFDATSFAGDATSHAHLHIGELDTDRSSHMRRYHRDKKAFFKGQLDELDLFRSALPPDQVASIFVAGSAGKFGSLGNLPTSAGQPPCIEALGQRIAALPPISAAPLNALYNRLLTAIAAGNRGLARQLARQIGDQAEAGFDRTYLTTQFHAVSHQVDACLDVSPLSGPR